MYRRPRRTIDTTVRCPECGQGRLQAHRSCLQSYCACSRCQARFVLADLAPVLTDDQFALLAEAVGEHLSDRV